MPIPKSISATALDRAVACKASWFAESYIKGSSVSNKAADLGTACHKALEDYVQTVHIDHKQEAAWDILYLFWNKAYGELFGTSFDTGLFGEGEAMLKRWYARDVLGANPRNEPLPTVISTETKSSYDFPTSVGPIPFNYIFDRLDLIAGTLEDPIELEVTDFKTIRAPVQPADLENKFQARCYSLMAQLRYPKVKRVWVTFDLLRHEKVGRSFNRDENVATWKAIKRITEQLILMPDKPDLTEYETISDACTYCIRKLNCAELQSNIKADGIETIADINTAIDLRYKFEIIAKAATDAKYKLDDLILKMAQETDEVDFRTDKVRMNLSARSTRNIDQSRVRRVVGDAIFEDYCETNLTLGSLDKMLKDSRVSTEQRKLIKSLFYKESGKPNFKYTELRSE